MNPCSLELSLNAVYDLVIHLERLGKDIIRDGRLRSEYSIGNGYDSRVLAAQSCKGYSIVRSIVELEMGQSLREHKYISFVKNLCEQLVLRVRCHKANIETALQHRQDLSGTWVSVGWVKAIRSIIYASKGDAHGVKPGDLRDVDCRHSGALLAGCVSGHMNAGEEEVFGNDILHVLAGKPIETHCMHEIIRYI